MTSPEALLFVEDAAIAEEHLAAARHDLRNRLAVIRGAAFYLRRRVEATDLWASDPRVGQFFQQMESEVDTANSILAERVTVVRPLTERVAITDAAECARDAARTARTEAGRNVGLELALEPANVDVDAAELCVALRCLVENAIEATSSGGLVTIAVRLDGGEVAMDVIDTGAGDGARMVEQGLEPFATTKAGHRGLGLNIAQRICKRHGGRFEIRALSPGACVSLRFPLPGGPRDDAPRAR